MTDPVESLAQRVAERVVDLLVQALDVNALVRRVDLNAALGQVDINALLARVDVNALLDRVDVNTLLDRGRREHPAGPGGCRGGNAARGCGRCG